MAKKIIISEGMLRGLVRTILNEISSNDAYGRFYKDFCTPEEWSIFMRGTDILTPVHRIALEAMKKEGQWDNGVASAVSNAWNNLPPEGRQYLTSLLEGMWKRTGGDITSLYIKILADKSVQKSYYTEDAYSKNGLVVLHETEVALVTCTTSYSAARSNYGDSHWCTSSGIDGRFDGFKMFMNYTIDNDDAAILVQFVDKKFRQNSIQAEYWSPAGLGMVCDFNDNEISDGEVEEHLAEMGLPRDFYKNVIDAGMFRRLMSETEKNIDEEKDYWVERSANYIAKMKKQFGKSFSSGAYDKHIIETIMRLGLNEDDFITHDTLDGIPYTRLGELSDRVKYPIAYFRIFNDRSHYEDYMFVNATMKGTTKTECDWVERMCEENDDMMSEIDRMALIIKKNGDDVNERSVVVGRYRGTWSEIYMNIAVIETYNYMYDATLNTIVNLKDGSVLINNAWGYSWKDGRVGYYRNNEDYLDDIVYVADANTGQFVGKMSRDEFLGQKKLHNGTADF